MEGVARLFRAAVGGELIMPAITRGGFAEGAESIGDSLLSAMVLEKPKCSSMRNHSSKRARVGHRLNRTSRLCTRLHTPKTYEADNRPACNLL